MILIGISTNFYHVYSLEIKIPDTITDQTAAAMMLKGMTAAYLLRRTYDIKPGDPILIMAAAGGVGQILSQWGKLLGAEVIGCVGSEEKAEIALKTKNRKLPAYEDALNSSLMLLTLTFFHIAIQISIPTIQTRKTFPGCVKSFSGFPLEGSSNYDGIIYVA